MLRRTSDLALNASWASARVLAARTPNDRQGRQRLHLDNDKSTSLRPIIKNFFLGKFNYEIFGFTRNEDDDEVDDLQMMSDSVEKFMLESVDSRKIDVEAAIPEETMTALKEMGLFGQQIPTEYGGLGLNATKFARLAENTGLDGAISTSLNAHQTLGLKGILLAGTEEQKEKYLPRLASGEDLAAFCLTEPGSGSDAQSIRTQAVLSEDGSHYVLNGNKIWISNGGLARVMTVFAKTEAIGPDGEESERLTAFIVERDYGGVISGEPQDTLGLRGSNFCSVAFENTPVPVENVLGEVGKGFKLAMNILNSDRYCMGSTAAGVMKFLLKDALHYASTREQFGKPIGHFPLIKEKIGKIAADIYAIESMTYLTAGLIDRYDESSLCLESAAVKIFSSEALWSAASECLQIYGGLGFTKDYQQERFLRDARASLLYGSTNELLRMLIAGSGMKFAGLQQPMTLRRLHKPQEYKMFNLRRIAEITRCRFKPSDPRLPHLVHPLLSHFMMELSKRANHFSYIVPETLVFHGRDTIEHQMVLKTVADVAIDMYAACAIANRISRALSQFAENIDLEHDLAAAAMQLALSRLHLNNMRISLGQLTTPDEEHVRIANRMYKNRGYCAEHALTRNW